MIKRFSYTCISYIFLISLLFSSEYKSLYLMEFENSSNDPRTDYLRYGLPEIVRIKYSDYDKVNIEYAPKSSSIYDDKISKLKDGILLYGNFNTIKNNIVISFNVYDVNTWEEKSNRSFKCDVDDIECIENAFYICVEENVMSNFCDYFDCMGVCEGAAVKDCLGKCEGSAKLDCDNLCEGLNVLDECGVCDSDSNNDCVQDCNGDWGGQAYLNECDVCVSGNTGKGYDYGLDCKGECWGSKAFDCKGVCGGKAAADCQGICNGTAKINECDVCVLGDTGNPEDKGKDCEGVCFGDAVVDECGVCNGFNKSCSDCFGVPYGKARLDNCANCDANPLNDCIQDCNEQWGGSAYINECLVCVGGSTGNDFLMGLDCNNECWGDAQVDECGICNGDGAVYDCGCHDLTEKQCDCDGNTLDICGVCGGDGVDLDNDGICDENDTFIGVEEKEDNVSSTKINLDGIVGEIDLESTISNSSVDLFIGSKSNSNIDNTKLLYELFDIKLDDAYDVIIDKANINSYERDNMVDISVPVKYSVNYDMFLDFFESFSYSMNDKANENVSIEIKKSNFNLSDSFEEYCSLMKYQIVPVLFFTDAIGNIKHIHVDSWSNYGLNNISDEIKISYSYNFMPLFSITPGSEYLYFNFDLNIISNTYDFTFSKNNISDYSKLYVKLFRAEDLETSLISYTIGK